MGQAPAEGSATYDPLKEALEDFKKIKKKIPLPRGENDHIKEMGEKLRSRAREIPGYIEQMGLVPTLAFCYGKAGDKRYKEIKDTWESEGELSGKAEGTGYAIYLYLILSRLKKYGMISSDEFDDAIEELDGRDAVLASKLLKPYLVHLKKLIEGYYESGEGA